MALTPSRITSLTHPDAINTINKIFENLSSRLAIVEKQAAQASRHITANPTLVFGTVNANSAGSTTVHVPGAAASLVAHANPITYLGSANLTWSAYVSGKDQVTVSVSNPTGSNIAVNSVSWNIVIS